MKRALPRHLLAVLLLAAGSLAAAGRAADVGISVNFGAPGWYGQIHIGDLPAPELIVSTPVVAIAPTIVVAGPPPAPLYLHVPPGHERHWARHCREYDACGRPVYFVSDRWYREVYVPRHRWDQDHEGDRPEGDHREHGEHGHGHEHNHGHDDDRD